MPTSLYDLTVPVFLRGFRNLDAVLAKGEAYAKDQGLDPQTLLDARLALDMHPLPAQIQRASDTAKFAAIRLGGVPNVSFDDSETTFAELHERIAKTADFLKSVDRNAIDGKEGVEVVLKSGDSERRLTGIDYALGFALPNFFFHVTTAYALIRHCGAPVGKLDYLGRD